MYNDAEHYAQLYRNMKPEFGFSATTRPEWQSWKRRFLPRLRAALGLVNMETDLAGHVPHAEQLGAEAMDGYTREQWQLWVEPTVPLPFYLLRPAGATGKLPLVLTPHGHNHPHIYAGIYHNEDEQKSIAEGDRDIAVQAVREGYLAIAPTTRAFGETRTAKDKQENKVASCRIALLHGLLVGRTAIGERVWDMSRLIDWALQRGDVDAKRIAITGNSGGGTISLFAAACEPRISVAVPSCYFCTFTGSIGSLFHCDCNYVPGILRLGEMADVAGLTAPRAQCIIAGLEDTIFPIDQVRIAFDHLRRVYDVAGVPNRVELYIGPGGHRYYRDGSWAFIRRHFGR